MPRLSKNLVVYLSVELNGREVQLISREVKGKTVFEVTTETLKSFYRIDCKNFEDGASRFKHEMNRIINEAIKKEVKKLANI